MIYNFCSLADCHADGSAPQAPSLFGTDGNLYPRNDRRRWQRRFDLLQYGLRWGFQTDDQGRSLNPTQLLFGAFPVVTAQIRHPGLVQSATEATTVATSNTNGDLLAGNGIQDHSAGVLTTLFMRSAYSPVVTDGESSRAGLIQGTGMGGSMERRQDPGDNTGTARSLRSPGGQTHGPAHSFDGTDGEGLSSKLLLASNSSSMARPRAVDPHPAA